MLKQSKFDWSDECQRAFRTIIDLLTKDVFVDVVDVCCDFLLMLMRAITVLEVFCIKIMDQSSFIVVNLTNRKLTIQLLIENVWLLSRLLTISGIVCWVDLLLCIQTIKLSFTW